MEARYEHTRVKIFIPLKRPAVAKRQSTARPRLSLDQGEGHSRSYAAPYEAGFEWKRGKKEAMCMQVEHCASARMCSEMKRKSFSKPMRMFAHSRSTTN